MSRQREPLHQPLTDAELARLVHDTVGPHAGVPTRTLLREWEVSRVELVEVGLTRLVVKHLPPGSLEARIITALRADGLRCVPPFLGLLPRPEVPDEIMVLEHIDGPALAEGSSQDAYRHAVGQLVLMQAAYWDRPERLRALGLPLHTPEHLEARARLAFDLTRERIGDGTYTHVEVSHLEAAAPALDAYLSALDFLAAQPLTLVHGDFHYGNIIIPAYTKRPPAPPVFLDWSSACGAIGLLDLVALLDVSERMMAPPPDPPDLLALYLARTRDLVGSWVGEADYPRLVRVCRVTRAAEELCWFARTGEDYGERAARELRAVQDAADPD